MQLNGATALVTGGASGLGLATVQALHEAGARVIIVDLPSSNGKVIAEDLGERAQFAPADVTDAEQVQAAIDLVSPDAPLRVAVNCAGIGTPGRVVGKNGPMPLEKLSSRFPR